MTRREEMHLKDKQRKENEKQDFLQNIGVLHDNTDGITIPSVEIMVESEQCYISYYISKYPNCFSYHISMYKKDYPFPVYYSKDFRENEIPAKYSKQFKELETYFNK